MTADQRKQALADAFRRVSDPEYGERLEWNTGGHRTYTTVEREADLALVRAALTPPKMPADLAEIQARLDNFGQIPCPRCKGTSWDPSGYGDACSDCDGQGEVNSETPLALVEIGKALAAKLVELRAAPQITAKEAQGILGDDVELRVGTRAKLRAIVIYDQKEES